MKIALVLLGLVLILALGGVGAFYGYPAVMQPKFDASSKTYVDQSISAIVNNWSQDALTTRCTPQLNESIAGEKVTTLFDNLLLLGSLQSYGGSQGHAKLRLSLHSGWLASATYSADATFKYGKVHFEFDLTQIKGQWFISAFQVSPVSNVAVNDTALQNN